jgi:hypothetical protein
MRARRQLLTVAVMGANSRPPHKPSARRAESELDIRPADASLAPNRERLELTLWSRICTSAQL